MWVVTPRYYYKRRRDAESLRAAPRGVTYLEGCFIDTCTDEKSAPGSGYFGIDIVRKNKKCLCLLLLMRRPKYRDASVWG